MLKLVLKRKGQDVPLIQLHPNSGINGLLEIVDVYERNQLNLTPGEYELTIVTAKEFEYELIMVNKELKPELL